MKSVWITGILIAACCGLLQLIMGFTGWYKDPVLRNRFWDLFFLIQLLCLIFGLVRTAKEGKRYWAQVGSGTLMSLIAGIILFIMVCLFATVFPSHSEAMAVLQRSVLEGAGRTPEEIMLSMNGFSGTAKLLVQGLPALMGTAVMGFLYSLLIAVVLRKKEP